MPRGNDAKQAATDLADAFGKGTGNAEQLIEAHNATRPLALVQASMKSVDEEATAELDLSKLAGPGGEEVISAAVRGGETIVLYVDESGRTQKALADDSKPKAKSKGGSKKQKTEAPAEAEAESGD